MYHCSKCGAVNPRRCCSRHGITSTLTRDGRWHVWLVYVNGLLRRKGWSPSLKDAALEAAKDVAELTKIEKRRSDAERDQMWTPNDEQMEAGHA